MTNADDDNHAYLLARHGSEAAVIEYQKEKARQAAISEGESSRRSSQRAWDWIFSTPKAVTTAPAQAATPAPVAALVEPVEFALLVTNGKRWTPEKLAELKAYREANTMPETAAKFGITAQRIRQLLPRKKPMGATYSALIHRPK